MGEGRWAGVPDPMGGLGPPCRALSSSTVLLASLAVVETVPHSHGEGSSLEKCLH